MFADVAFQQLQEEFAKQSKYKPRFTQNMFLKNTSTKNTTQRTHTSIDNYISMQRKLYNELKFNVNKLQKISNMATQQITGVNPIEEKFKPLPIKQSYRANFSIDDDYHDKLSSNTPDMGNQGSNNSHSFLRSSKNKNFN